MAYSVPGAILDTTTIVWSSLPLQPLVPERLTPFSYSVLAEIVSRAWYDYYDRLGFEPAPRPHLMQQQNGQAYLNLTLGARLEAQHASIEPPVFLLNEEPFALCSWEKPGLLGNLRAGRQRKKIDAALDSISQELASVTAKARAWYDKTQTLTWTQAEVLQVMEEIERVGLGAMVAFLAARINLDRHYRILLQALDPTLAWSARLSLINNALCDLDDLVEAEMATALLEIASTLTREAFVQDVQAAADLATLEPVQRFLAEYGHRSLGEAETRWPRWSEDAQPVAQALVACVKLGGADQTARQRAVVTEPAKIPAKGSTQKLLQAAGPQGQKSIQTSLDSIRPLYRLQSSALHALAYIWAGTRTWAQAAAREAMSDDRLAAADDIFYFELEEIKQMMTGEWNISNREQIRSTVAQRREQVRRESKAPAPEIWAGDVAGIPQQQGLPGVAGQATGPLRCWGPSLPAKQAPSVIVGGQNLTSGWALALPAAAGFVAAGGTPLDPFVAAARAWHRPVVVGLGDAYRQLVEGAQTTVDGTAVTVRQ